MFFFILCFVYTFCNYGNSSILYANNTSSCKGILINVPYTKHFLFKVTFFKEDGFILQSLIDFLLVGFQFVLKLTVFVQQIFFFTSNGDRIWTWTTLLTMVDKYTTIGMNIDRGRLLGCLCIIPLLVIILSNSLNWLICAPIQSWKCIASHFTQFTITLSQQNKMKTHSNIISGLI